MADCGTCLQASASSTCSSSLLKEQQEQCSCSIAKRNCRGMVHSSTSGDATVQPGVPNQTVEGNMFCWTANSYVPIGSVCHYELCQLLLARLHSAPPVLYDSCHLLHLHTQLNNPLKLLIMLCPALSNLSLQLVSPCLQGLPRFVPGT